MNRDDFIGPFLLSELPAWKCSHCKKGVLVREKNTLQQQETASSKSARGHDEWEPDWISERFAVMLRCSHCKDPAFAVGNVRMTQVHDEFGEPVTADALAPTFFEPAPLAIHIPDDCPKCVYDEIARASSLFWPSPSAAANAIRTAVELLLDHRRIPRKKRNAKAKYYDLSLHRRIELYKAHDPDVGELLLAIKWLGNSGSHLDKLAAKDVLDAFELLERVLEEIHDAKSARLKKMASAINRQEGPAAVRRRKHVRP